MTCIWSLRGGELFPNYVVRTETEEKDSNPPIPPVNQTGPDTPIFSLETP